MTTVASEIYLSRLVLDQCSRQVRSELAQPYEMHRTLMHAFEKHHIGGKEKPRENFGVLFHVDADDCRNRAVVYVQSTAKPDWSFLPSCGNYLLANFELLNPDCKKIAGIYQRLQNGQILSFRLRANPTKCIAKPTRGDEELKGKRVGLLREEEQVKWLVRKGVSCGFEVLMKKIKDRNGKVEVVPSVNVCREGKQECRKMEEGHSHKMTHLTVCFDGVLRIIDAGVFRNSLTRGIGPAKAFGCGLMLVKKI